MFMLKQLVLVAALAIVSVACDANVDQTQATPEPAEPKRMGKLTESLIDLALIGAKGAKNVGMESREVVQKYVEDEALPYLEKLKQNEKLTNTWNKVQSDERFQKGVATLKPYAVGLRGKLEGLGTKLRPYVEDKLKPYLDGAKQIVDEHEKRQAVLKQSKQQVKPQGEQQQEPQELQQERPQEEQRA